MTTTTGFLLKAERDLKKIDLKSMAAGGEIQIPPLELSADISKIPLREVLNVLAKKIGAKIFTADDLSGEQIWVHILSSTSNQLKL